jgi:hypothetical protein
MNKVENKKNELFYSSLLNKLSLIELYIFDHNRTLKGFFVSEFQKKW